MTKHITRLTKVVIFSKVAKKAERLFGEDRESHHRDGAMWFDDNGGGLAVRLTCAQATGE